MQYTCRALVQGLADTSVRHTLQSVMNSRNLWTKIQTLDHTPHPMLVLDNVFQIP
jgi:hypothetical protein